MRRRGAVEDYIEVVVAATILTSATLLGVSIVLSHIALGG